MFLGDSPVEAGHLEPITSYSIPLCIARREKNQHRLTFTKALDVTYVLPLLSSSAKISQGGFRKILTQAKFQQRHHVVEFVHFLRHKPSDDGIILNGSIETLLRQMLKQSKPTIVETSDLLKGIQTHLVSLLPAGMHIYTILCV